MRYRRFLDPGELLRIDGVVIDGVAYLTATPTPTLELFGRLIVLVTTTASSLMDTVGCAARARPAYLYSGSPRLPP